MKKTLVMILTLTIILAMAATAALADYQWLTVNWWQQPGSYPQGWNERWEEIDNVLTIVDYEVEKVNTIATDLGCGDPYSIRNVDLSFEMTIPDAEEYMDGWAGFYVRGTVQPQSGIDGVLVHINSNGVSILDVNTNMLTIEERLFAEAIIPNEFNKVRVLLDEKNFIVTINDVEVINSDECYPINGFLGFSAVGYGMELRNVVAYVNGAEEAYTAYTVAEIPAE